MAGKRRLHPVVSLLATAGALLAGERLIPGVQVDGWAPALLGALALAMVNILIKPVLSLLTLPITILTLGLFSFVLSIAMLALASWLVEGVRIADALSLVLLAALVAGMQALAWLVFARRKGD